MDKRFTFRMTSQISSQYRWHLLPDVKYLVVIFILTTNLIIHPVRSSNIICSKSEYVRSGIEFKQCQDETLQSFQPESAAARGKTTNINKFIYFISKLYSHNIILNFWHSFNSNLFQKHLILALHWNILCIVVQKQSDIALITEDGNEEDRYLVIILKMSDIIKIMVVP